jgi:hypothetical protein
LNLTPAQTKRRFCLPIGGTVGIFLAMSIETDWNEARIARYITEKIEESLDTEFKSAGALDKDSNHAKLQITKDVSAMANAEGGIIIYGLAEHHDPKLKHLAERIDPANRAKISKEWLEQVISQIRPRIVDLRIHPVPLASGQNDVVYVVEIPPGTTAHQAADHRYYKRYNFEAVPMVDYEVRDVMNRVKTPRLEIEMMPYVKGAPSGIMFSIEAWLLNSSDAVTAYDVTVRLLNRPLNWQMPPNIWKLINTYDEGAKYVLQHPLHPGDRYALAKWEAGDGNAPIKMFISRGRMEQKHDLSEATFSADEYKIRINIFAKNQSAMEFNCHFSKEEMEKRITKRFQPLKMTF